MSLSEDIKKKKAERRMTNLLDGKYKAGDVQLRYMKQSSTVRATVDILDLPEEI